MKFINNLYQLYKDQLTGDEEDALIIINGILQNFSDEDIHKLISDMSNREQFEMFSLYLYEKFRIKVAEEGLGQILNQDDQDDSKFLH
ncbi:DUF6154 family protein [Halalkalibacter krulwichiae]|uniref:Uncharacterized protein n=1 Tax=Halalkalibacter krulwichiae TaxID=199441 RepID=A0A1X9MAY2_9BACI|nr:DUF6154 family protein [Halalkalibacter krulwichiae]ARK30605.1 hypothetical protein BkAM31D_12625 [Halalkalibacter krulwichiae]